MANKGIISSTTLATLNKIGKSVCKSTNQDTNLKSEEKTGNSGLFPSSVQTGMTDTGHSADEGLFGSKWRDSVASRTKGRSIGVTLTHNQDLVFETRTEYKAPCFNFIGFLLSKIEHIDFSGEYWIEEATCKFTDREIYEGIKACETLLQDPLTSQGGAEMKKLIKFIWCVFRAMDKVKNSGSNPANWRLREINNDLSHNIINHVGPKNSLVVGFVTFFGMSGIGSLFTAGGAIVVGTTVGVGTLGIVGAAFGLVCVGIVLMCERSAKKRDRQKLTQRIYDYNYDIRLHEGIRNFNKKQRMLEIKADQEMKMRETNINTDILHDFSHTKPRKKSCVTPEPEKLFDNVQSHRFCDENVVD